LVAGQRDRFAVSLSLGLPGRAAELSLAVGKGGMPELGRLQPISELAEWNRLRSGLDDIVFLHPDVTAYALDLVDAIRARTSNGQPLSTRAALTLLRVARGTALVSGRDHVAPDDVQRAAVPVLAHRVLDVAGGQLPGARNFVGETLRAVPAPPPPGG